MDHSFNEKQIYLTLSRKRLLTIYKSFLRPYLDYVDMLLDKPTNESFTSKTSIAGCLACTCYTATLEAEFLNGVGSKPAGGNSHSIGGWVQGEKYKEISMTKYWDLADS